MKQITKGWLAALALALVILALPAQAQLIAGRDYVAIEPPVTTDNPAKIEVIEFFSYACPHCNDLNVQLDKWAAKLPADVDFKRMPVGFNQPFYQLMARLFYALEAIGELQRLDGAVFNALHVKGLKLIDEKSVTEWVKAQGVDARKFSEAFNAFGVVSKARRADQLANAARITGVPTIIVDGRFTVSSRGPEETLAVTDKVIDMRRNQISPKKPESKPMKPVSKPK